MSGTFPCPHCGAVYPVKPVLVGRAVRCTTCKLAFCLRPDGVADKVEQAAPAPPSPPPPPPPPPRPAAPAPPAAATRPAPAVTAPAPPSPPPRPAAPASAPTATATRPAPAVATPTPPPAPNPAAARSARHTRTERLNQQQEEARKAMAASLASAASAALAAETVKRESETERQAERRRKAAAPTSSEGAVGDIGPVVLTGTGEREHHRVRLWILISAAALVLAGGIVALSSIRSDTRLALDAYAASVEAKDQRYGARLGAYQARAWFAGAPALTDLGSLRIGSTRRLPFAGIAAALAPLKDLTWHQGHQLWTGPLPERSSLEQLWNPKRDEDANLKRLADLKITVITRREFERKLAAGGWSGEDAVLLTQMLNGQANHGPSPDWMARKLLAGELPEAVELAPFTGRHGTMLIDLGRNYKQREVDYEGQLMRFIGAGWPAEWRVLAITTTSRD